MSRTKPLKFLSQNCEAKEKRNFHHFLKTSPRFDLKMAMAPLLVLEEKNKQCCYLLIIMCLFHYLNHPTPRRKKKDKYFCIVIQDEFRAPPLQHLDLTTSKKKNANYKFHPRS